MPNPFQHPAAKAMLERVASHFQNKTVWQLPRNQLVFVCGGPVTGAPVSVRKQFLDWAKPNIPDFRFFLAETVAVDVIDHAEPRFLNLAAFESILADIADCIVLIPESVGSWAEIGFFSANTEIAKKCLVFNALSKQGDSFLNVGPIQTINEHSNYRPTVVANFEIAPINFQDVRVKLERYRQSKRQRIEVSDFKALSGHQQFAIIHFIISIFPSLDLEGLIDIFKAIFDRYDQVRIRRLVSILVAVAYVKRIPGDEFRIFANPEVPPLLEIQGLQIPNLLAEHLAHFQKYAPELIPEREAA
jgi:hypothetical protein